MGDPNNRDVVIPLIEEEPAFTAPRNFPWRPVLRFLGLLLAAALFCAYALRYGGEFLLSRRARRNDLRGLQALYRLLLMRLAAEGRPLKPPAKTSREYAAFFPEEPCFASFAARYTELRYREIADPSEKQGQYRALREEAGNIIAGLRRPGFRGFLCRFFSLRGLSCLL
jgi:hypothetical protein